MTRTIIVMLLALLVLACKRDNEYRSFEGVVWSTVYSITYQGGTEFADSVTMVMDNMGKSLNVFDDASVVSAVNNSSRYRVDGMFITVFKESKRIHNLTGGAFDPTLKPLIDAWGFGKERERRDTLHLDSLLQLVGLEKAYLAGDTLVKTEPRLHFNFSAIAKGYACDLIADMFKRNGIVNFLVEIGGEIRVSGKNPRGSDWRISIDRPTVSDSGIEHESQAVVAITDCGVATSGNYRNYHTDKSGNMFGHTINPRTGRPARTDLLSATIVAPTSMEADALATACMVMGFDDSRRLLDSLGYPAMLIYSDMNVWTSSRFNKLEVKNN